MSIKIIAAISRNGVIGKENLLPWDYKKYKADMANFKTQTTGCTVIMGRKTFESMGSRLLPKRKNIIISRKEDFKVEGAEVYSSLEQALAHYKAEEDKMISEGGPNASAPASDIWLIGGSSIYQDGLKYADQIHVTEIPEVIEGDNLIYFPYISTIQFHKGDTIILDDETELSLVIYRKNHL